jgi:hypothetical protein
MKNVKFDHLLSGAVGCCGLITAPSTATETQLEETAILAWPQCFQSGRATSQSRANNMVKTSSQIEPESTRRRPWMPPSRVEPKINRHPG